MHGPAAVGIDDDLAAGEPGVGLRPADQELARAVNVNFVLASIRSPSTGRATSSITCCFASSVMNLPSGVTTSGVCWQASTT